MMIFVLFSLPTSTRAQDKSNTKQAPNSYTLKLPVDEVVLTFHASDAKGLAIQNLKATEVHVLDNGAPPRRTVAFDSLMNRPMRAAILLDTSGSMLQVFAKSKFTATQFAERIFRQQSDQAMVMDFAYSSGFAQPWTSNREALSRSIENTHLGGMNPLPGTAIFDAVFRACYYGFNKMDPSTTGNFILLFTDGEDNAGHISAEEALRACERSNTVIYAFRAPSSSTEASTGPKNLEELANRTGGRVFPVDDTPDAIERDLKMIESEIRDQYRLVYTPANFKHNGAFHSIELQLPDRVDRVDVRSGYFAPVR